MKAPRKRSDLLRPQIRFVNKVKRLRTIILALPMGAGKTVIVLTALLDLLDDRKVNKVLVVAPLLVASATWPDEFEEWEHLRDLTWTLVRAEDDDDDIADARRDDYQFARDALDLPIDQAAAYAQRMSTRRKEWKRRRLIRRDTEIHIINREMLPWVWEYFGRGKRWPYDVLVVDEASMFKNAKMKTKLKRLTRFGVAVKARPFISRCILLTGTPAPKGIMNLWGLAKVADGGKRLGRSMKAFKDRWFNQGYMRWEIEPKDGAEEDIMARLGDIMFSLREEDVVQLPPRIDQTVKVTLPRKVLQEYKRFERELVSEVYDVEAVNRGVLHNKLLQFANGSMYQEDGKDVWIHDKKLEALEALIEDANGAPVLVAYSFKFDLMRIRKAFKRAVVFGEGDVRKTKTRWNNGDIGLMLAHAASVGHGQNIQYGGSISVWYGLTPDLELYQQFNKRLHRRGQRDTVFNYHIVAEGTYDEKILPLLSERGATQDRILNSVRLHLTN
ncbi:DEAD/DEAH box helicase [Amorphus orientalis]|uniref:SNF2 family DNA or RNA helicase n=1 Tax=Amorphus orientalis TaxID=649198 RepID=A0AAE3VT80_9HYPH|nr:DEAD/DEAH box helicase [Amorphus orientalis]MDQ0317782.1 SNF2 family DNA or RNA helicase [Amorphus orientalis]